MYNLEQRRTATDFTTQAPAGLFVECWSRHCLSDSATGRPFEAAFAMVQGLRVNVLESS